MAGVKLAKQLIVETENKVGMLAEITGEISRANINIEHICAYTSGDKAIFMLFVADNEKVKSSLARKGFKVFEEEVLILGLANKVGSAYNIAEKLKEAGVDLKYIYGTTCGCECDCRLVFSSDNNRKAEEVLR